MARSGFLTSVEVERFLGFARPEIKEIVLELRNLVSRACPHATERILWGGLSYHDSLKGGPVRGAICQIEVRKDSVRISFIHGARLTDPHVLLAGKRLSKRYVEITSYEQTPWDEIFALIEGAAGLDPTTFGPLPESSTRR